MHNSQPTPESFIARWRHADGSELANAQSFTRELCELLGVPIPDPARADTQENAYVYERRVIFRHGDGSTSEGRIDCYRRGAFVLEAKKLRQGPATKGFDDGLLRARAQAENYARNLPAEEGRPPFLIVVDVGHVIELYAEFSRSGGAYTPFPGPGSHRLRLEDLRHEAIRERLRQVWLDPLALDPSRISARVTREISSRLADVARALESSGHDPEAVAGFLSRCLFCMFAEDVGLLPRRAFTELLESFLPAVGADECPAQFIPLMAALWREMDVGGFSVVLRRELPRFNGKLFKAPDVLPLTRTQIAQLLEAARSDWTLVEPAIFGTLLERALNPLERHALGAHYTPRAYVERLVLPTVIEPLRGQWNDVKAAALVLAGEGRADAARAELHGFHHHLCGLKVLDPACGSGNFLYVTLEHMKRLEGEVLDLLGQLGDAQGRLEAEGLTVDPHQFLGLELNPRAAAIAELVLWIGYLQWHFKSRGNALPPSPILKDFRNIECRDAVLAHDGMDYVMDAAGRPVSRWDGRSFKKHPVTGEDVPDETAQVPLERYRNPRRAAWPQADFVVGNPPFIGNKRMRLALGDGYTEALRGAWPEVPESADLVMYWWHQASQLVAAGKVSRFGFITTNSLTQSFNRRVIEGAMTQGVHLAYAIPDHPWVDSADGAAVRIAMSVGSIKEPLGMLAQVISERDVGGEGLEVVLDERVGAIHADLRVGANVAGASVLRANEGLSNRGMIPHGEGFLVTPEHAPLLDNGALCRPYRNGKDLTDRPRGVLVIDTFGLTEEQLRAQYPATWQWLHDRVKPERDLNARKATRENWWLFGEQRKVLRAAHNALTRYIATGQTAKHRLFQFLDNSILPDDKLIAIALEDAYALGVLSSRVHVVWALAAGATLEDRPVYNKSTCFDAFPFPDSTPEQQARIRALAEELDAHRKRQQALHPGLTLTGMYNVLEALRAGRPLSAKEKTVHDQGLVSLLKQIHDDLDAAVLAAYGWDDLPEEEGRDETLLQRLADLNARRAAEEAGGWVRWLRPEYQAGEATHPLPGPPLEGEGAPLSPLQGGSWRGDGIRGNRIPWPASLPEQVAAVAAALQASPLPLDEEALAARFTGKGSWKKRLPSLLETLAALGRARRLAAGYVAT